MKAVLFAVAVTAACLSPAAAETNTGPSTPERPSSVTPQQMEKPAGGPSEGTVPRPNQPATQPSAPGIDATAKGSGPDGMAGPHNPVPHPEINGTTP
ncbi:hypothetical protein DLM45_04760 [Hyphomicrobium methylovorum]|uniref:hypothetical protein n=1 Tax=Hyphomicrobium methylovorum TaxID=84 RepID=UPI0015E76441|nr:hypothetical protein [Hyphomicrobium methylovorum]MBA2125535.1 hypothetical protein [Hyphomicrobium methylovorum]